MSLSWAQMIISTLLMLLLLYASATDIKDGKIPLVSCGAAACMIFFIRLYSGLPVLEPLIHAALAFCVLLINALFFSGGGGDCILVAVIAFAMGGWQWCFILFLTCLIMIAYRAAHHLLPQIFRTTCRGDWPMAPFFYVATLCTFFA